MTISNKFRNLTGASVLSLAAAFGTGCSTSGPIYSEGPDYNGQRTRITNQPMDCTIRTQRSGTYNGGSTTQVGNGTFTETCVSSPYADQRRSLMDREIDNAKRNAVRRTGQEINRALGEALRNALD